MRFRMEGNGSYSVHGRRFRSGVEYDTDDQYIINVMMNRNGVYVWDPAVSDGVEEDLIEYEDMADGEVEEYDEIVPLLSIDDSGVDDTVEMVVIPQSVNDFGKYDCRAPGCERVGDMGFPTERGARTHEGRCPLVNK